MNYRGYQHMPQSHSRRLPETLTHQQTLNSGKKQTLTRKDSFGTDHNDEIFQLIGKIRSLQDDLLNQRFKSQSFERRIRQYEKIIDNLQYELTSQSYQVDKYKHQIEMSNEKNMEILKYEENLQAISEEIQQLNNVLVRKNKDYEELLEENRYLEHEGKRLKEENHLFVVNFGIWEKELDCLTDEYANRTNRKCQKTNGLVTRRKGSKQDARQVNFETVNSQIETRFQLLRQTIEQIINEQKNKICSLQEAKRQLSTECLSQKESKVKLQYEVKLLQERNKDTSKRQQLMSQFYNSKKVEDIIEEMLRKQDEYLEKIDQLTRQNSQLKHSFEELEQSSNVVQKVYLKEKDSMIESLKRQNQYLEQSIEELRTQLQVINERYEQIITTKQSNTLKESQNELQSQKQIRKLQEQNYSFKIKIQSLVGQISLLNKEIDILKGHQEGQSGYVEQESQV